MASKSELEHDIESIAEALCLAQLPAANEIANRIAFNYGMNAIPRLERLVSDAPEISDFLLLLIGQIKENEKWGCDPCRFQKPGGIINEIAICHRSHDLAAARELRELLVNYAFEALPALKLARASGIYNDIDGILAYLEKRAKVRSHSERAPMVSHPNTEFGMLFNSWIKKHDPSGNKIALRIKLKSGFNQNEQVRAIIITN